MKLPRCPKCQRNAHKKAVDDVIKTVKLKGSGRTRYEGQAPYPDELLVAEIERLRKIIAETIEILK